MVDQELVVRSTDTRDRRLVLIRLTEKGKQLMEEARDHRRKKIENMLSYLTDDQKVELLVIFQTLNQKLK